MHKEMRLKKHKRHLFTKYLENYQRLKQLEEENDFYRKKIDELELQIKYMPLGKEYDKAKEHFESLISSNENMRSKS